MTTTTQRVKPTQSSSIISSSDHRPTVVLCSSKDDHLLSQDICTLCGSLGKADEGNLISCSQCGQCYHPYCVNIKGLKVVVSKGWRCLECTVCETCGQPGDEAKLLLCDECELSCHTYCLEPPLEEVPQDAWKCHWCVVCLRCGSHSPGVKSDWQKNYTECGPCSSLSTCPKCKVDYNENDLIIQCKHCSRWVHARCDSIRDEDECELASELGYTCLLCRPKDEIPLYLVHRKLIDSTSQNSNSDLSNPISNQLDTREDSQANTKHHDTIGQQKSLSVTASISNSDINLKATQSAISPYLSKNLQSDFPRPQSAPSTSSSEFNNTDSIKRPASSLHFTSNDPKNSSLEDAFVKNDATNQDDLNESNIDDNNGFSNQVSKANDDVFFQGLHMVDGVYLSETGLNFIKSQKLEPAKRQRAKRSAKVQKLDDCSLDDTNRDDDEENKLMNDDRVDDDGRRKRVRKLSKVGIGGFTIRQRGARVYKDDDFNYSLSNDVNEVMTPPQAQTPTQQQITLDRANETAMTSNTITKPKRIRKKPKKKPNLIDQYPSYLQEAFFGKDLLSKSSEEKYSETLNDCPTTDLQLEDTNDNLKSTIGSDGVCRSANSSNLLKSNVKLTDSTNEITNDSIESMKLNDLRQLSKDEDLMDVFVGEVQSTDDLTEPKKDAFDPDLLSTDFDPNMIDSKDVEDLLNGLGSQTSTQKVNTLPLRPEVFDQTAVPHDSLMNHNTGGSGHQHVQPPQPHPIPQQHNHQHPHPQQPSQQQLHPQQHHHHHHHHPHHQQQLPNNQQPMNPLVQPPPPTGPTQSTVHHIQPQTQNQMISSSMSPHQVTPMHQISPNTVQHPPNHQMQSNPHHPMPYEMGMSMPMHPSNVNTMNQCNPDQNNPMVVSTPGPIMSPSVNLSPRTKMSSPCILSSHRPPSTASSIGPMPSPAQTMHHPLPPPSQSNQSVLSPMIEPEPGSSQYQMPPSPWTTGSQPDLHRQYSSPQVPSEAGWQSTTPNPDLDSQARKNTNQNWEAEEALGAKATKSAILYANIEYPDLKKEHPSLDDRIKQINKLWRQLAQEKRKPYVDKARENRSALKVSNKPVAGENVSAAKKAGPPQVLPQHQQPKPHMTHEVMHMHSPQTQPHPQQHPVPQQPQHMNPMPGQVMHQSQDARWKQPMAVEGQPQPPARFLPPQGGMQMQQQSHNFVEAPQHHMSPQQQQSPIMQQNQYSPQPRPHYVGQPRVATPANQFIPGSAQVARLPMGVAQQQVRIPHPHPQQVPQQQQSIPQSHPQAQQQHQQPPPQQIGQFQQQHRPQTPRYHNPNQMNHKIPAQPHMNQPVMQQQQPIMGTQGGMPPQQHQRAQMQPAQQFSSMHQQTGYIDNQAPQQQPIHGQHVHPQQSSQQYPPQQQQQHHMMYNNQPHHNQQMNVRRQFQPPPPPQQQQQQSQQQHYTYQQQQLTQPQPQHQMQGYNQVGSLEQAPTPQTPNQQPQMHYNSLPPARIDPLDDTSQLLEDEDDLKDLGADFNILEYADPEPDKGASTNAGKNNIELDAELEDYFDDREGLDEKRSHDPMLVMGGQQVSQQPQQQQQQHQQPPHQMMYQQQQSMHQQPHQGIQQNHSFVENQHHVGPQQQQQQQQQPPQQQSPIVQNQYSPQRPHYVGQPRVATPTNQFVPNSPQTVRPPMGVAQVRIQHPQQVAQQPQSMAPQQQASFQQQQHRPHAPRYHNPNQMNHKLPAQQPHMNQPGMQQQQQPIMGAQGGMPPQQHQRAQMPPNQQFSPMHQQTGFIDQAPPQQQQPIHGQHVHQQQAQQYPPHQQQQQQQHHMMYNNQPHHNQQMNVRRQFQPAQQQPQQQHYTYQQQQQQQHQMQSYPPMGTSPHHHNQQQQQHVIKPNSNDMMVHTKSPIIGDAITSMEFTMYEQGSGSNNEAVNLPMQSTTDSNVMQNPPQERPMSSNPESQTMVPAQNISYGQQTVNSVIMNASEANAQRASMDISAQQGVPVVKQNQDAKVDPNFRYVNSNPSSGRSSACANNQELSESKAQATSGMNQTSTSNSDKAPSGGGGQPQNQLLKQLLGNCSSADNPPQDNSSNSPSLLLEPTIKGPPNQSVGGQSMMPKQISGVPTISFQLDSNQKNGQLASGSMVVGSQQSMSSPNQIKGGNMIASSLQPQQRQPTSISATTASTSTGNYEIKTYNVVPQQGQPIVNLNMPPTPVRVQQPPTQINTNPIVQKRPDAQIISRNTPVIQNPRPIKQPEQSQVSVITQNSNQGALSINNQNIQMVKKVKTQNGDDCLPPGTIRPSSNQINQMIPTGSSEQQPPVPQPNSRPAVVKSSATKRKNDYIAERRAALEKEKTPPPREVKPKKRTRGPNKRSRVTESSDEVRTIDSNSNTSEASQQPESQAPPPRKRVRKSRSKVTKAEFENNQSMLTSLAIKIHSELPMIPVKEPEFSVNNNVGTIFACGDLNSKSSKLRGAFGRAVPVATANLTNNKKGKRKYVGYYHEEFPANLGEPSIEVYNSRIFPQGIDRDCASPSSIISGSSSEAEEAEHEILESKLYPATQKVSAKIALDSILEQKPYTPDLDKLSADDKKSSSQMLLKREEGTTSIEQHAQEARMDVNNNNRSASPSIPISIKLPMTCISLTHLDEIDHDRDDNNKENLNEVTQAETNQESRITQHENSTQATTDQTGTSLNMRLRDHGNVSVTLTLTNKEVDGVKRVLSSLSKLIDYTIPPSCITQSPESIASNSDNNTASLNTNSFPRLLSGGTQNNQLALSPTDHKDLKFDEQNYIHTEQQQPRGQPNEDDPSLLAKASAESTEAAEPLDIKPEFCCRCKAIVVDRGIRKNISEIPESTVESMQKSNIVEAGHVGELVFCSVHCYAASIMCIGSSASKSPRSRDDKKASYLIKAPPGLPPMSPMMEDDEDDIGNNNHHHRQEPLDKSAKLHVKSPPIGVAASGGGRKRWLDIKYTRWTNSHFEQNKSTSPINSMELALDSNSNTTATDNNNSNLQSLSTQQLLINQQAESSVDSNESDNSTTYSQSTSGGGGGGGKLANCLDEAIGGPASADLVPKVEHHSLTAACTRLSTNTRGKPDVIAPWPKGIGMVQLKPIKPQLYTKTNQVDDGSLPMEVEETYRDTRKCVLCHEFGDGDSDGPARLLNLFIDGWVHLNCALWSLDVYELANGALMNVELACRKAMTCSLCHRPGATLKCFKPRCPNYYHFVCATKERCSFYEDKSVQCRQHSKAVIKELTSKELTSFVVKRRVYVNRDEQKQVAEMIQGEQQNVMRIGSLVFLNIGQLLPHQLMAFHNQNNIFPVGYKIIRYYWSYRQLNKRCKYLCTIEENDGKPQFRIVAQEIGFEEEKFCGDSPQSVWRPIIDMIVDLRKEVPDTITTFPAYIKGEDLFGLTEPNIVRILESLPGVEALTDYVFKFGRSPLLELPLAINPTGCARTEPKLRTHFKRPYTIHTASSVPKSRLQSLGSGDSSSPYVKQFVGSKQAQYRKMKSEWRNNVVLARSQVQGLGLYAARDIEKHTMVIEYIGMLIRNEIANKYERIHEAHNRGIYMFRLDEDRVIDATLAGGLARYINHSCNPNCVAETVEIDREKKILIIANRKILKGEELGYDYKLAYEDDQHKISCLCGAPTCKKWMN